MQTTSSEKRTCNEFRSASEYTATVAIPSSLHAQMTRRAISPRFATRILLNIFIRRLLLAARTDSEQWLTVFHWLPILNKNPQHFPAAVGLNLVHQLHGFDNAQSFPVFHISTNFHKRLRAGAGRTIESANDGWLHGVQVFRGPGLHG